MKDEITAARRNKRRRYNLKRFFWFIVVVVLIIFSVSVANAVTRTTFLDIGDFFTVLFKSGSYPVQLGSGVPLQTEEMAMSYAVLTQTELRTYASGGGRLQQVNHSLAAPCIATSNTRIVLYSVGGKDALVFNRSEQLAALRAENVVVDAAVSNNGTVILLTQSDRYACHLEIYKGGSFEKLMTWNGSSGFPLAACIRPDGRLAAAARVSASAGGVVTVIAVVDINGKEELYQCTVPELAAAMYFEGDTLIVITDREITRISASGELAGTKDFDMMPLLAVARDKGPVAVALGDNNRPNINTITVFDKNLNVQCHIEGCGVVRDMVISGNRIYTLGDRVINEYNLRGELLRRYETDTNTKRVLDVNGIIAFQPDTAKRITTPIKGDEE